MSVPVYFWFPILVSLGMGFMTLNLPPVANQLMDLFGVGYAGLSFLFSAYYWTHSLVQVPAGVLVDRIGVVRSLILCIVASFASGIMPLLAPESLTLAVAARLVLGLCTGGFFLITVKIVKILTPPVHIARVQGWQGAAFSFGTMLPYLTLPYAGSMGWVVAYLSCAALSVLYAVSVFRLPLRTIDRSRTGMSLRQVWDSMKVIATSKHIWFIGCSHGFAFGTLTSVIGNWLPSMLEDSSPGSNIESWALATSVLLLVGMAGRIFGGEAPRFMPRGLILRRVVLCIGVGYWALSLSHNPWAIIGLTFVLAALCGGTYASVFTLTIDTAQPAYVASAVGFMNMVGCLVNVLLVILLGYARGVSGSFSLGLSIAGSLALVLWLWSRKLIADIEPVTRD